MNQSNAVVIMYKCCCNTLTYTSNNNKLQLYIPVTRTVTSDKGNDTVKYDDKEEYEEEEEQGF